MLSRVQMMLSFLINSLLQKCYSFSKSVAVGSCCVCIRLWLFVSLKKRSRTRRLVRYYPYYNYILLRLLKYGFCKKLLRYKWTSDQLNTFFLTFWLVTQQTSQKVRKKVFNWSEAHLYQSNFLQNPSLSDQLVSFIWEIWLLANMTTFTKQFSWPSGVEGCVNGSQISDTYIGFSLITANSIASKLEG